MIRRHAISARWLPLGMAMIAALAVAILPRGISLAGPPAPVDGKALRNKIVALHGEIAFIQLEIEIEHASILARVKENAEVPSAFRQFEEAMDQLPADGLTQMVEELLAHPQATSELKEADLAAIRKEFDQAKLTGDEAGTRRAAAHLFEEGKKVEGSQRRAKLAAQKQDYAGLARELAGKRLDLEDSERQYRDAR